MKGEKGKGEITSRFLVFTLSPLLTFFFLGVSIKGRLFVN